MRPWLSRCCIGLEVFENHKLFRALRTALFGCLVQRIAVGSTNKVKVGAVESVVKLLWPAAEIRSLEVPSGVNEQPCSDEETLLGATNRARCARENTSADLGFGLEGGVVDMDYGMFLCTWVVAIDRYGTIGRGGSTRMELPPIIANELRQGKELGPVIDAYLRTEKNNHKNGAIGLFTNDLVTRQEAFEYGVKYALVRFINPQHYK